MEWLIFLNLIPVYVVKHWLVILQLNERYTKSDTEFSCVLYTWINYSAVVEDQITGMEQLNMQINPLADLLIY